MNLTLSGTYLSDLELSLDQVINLNELFNSKIMITGATGLIGSYLVDMLMMANYKFNANITVYAIGRNLKRLKQRFSDSKYSGLKLVEHDVTSDAAYDFDVDYIVNAAGNAYPAAFNQDPVGTILCNIIGTQKLLDYGKDHAIKRFLYISSGEIYGQGDLTLEAYSENYSGYVNPLEPRSCYPISKRAAENLCVAYSKQFGSDTVIVRPCHTYGPNSKQDDNRANVQFINDVMADRDVVLKSSGTQLRSYCYISDCASAILTVLISGKCSEAYNVAFKDSCLTISEFAELVAEIAGKNVVYEMPDEISVAEQTPITRQVLSSEKLEGLGWSGSFTPELGISHLLKSLKGE